MVKKILLITAILLLCGGIVGLVLNHQEAGRQVKAIELADMNNSGDATPNLVILKSYSGSHMYSSAVVTLSGSYSRAQAAASASVAAQSAAAKTSADIYAAAQQACGGKGDSITQAKCNSQYIASHMASVPQTTPVAQPQPDKYKYSFKSPLWAPDLAGILLLSGVLVGILWVFITISSRKRL